MRRGEIWLVALDPTIGGEMQKTRPCLIVSPDALVRGLRTVIVVPLTSRGRPASFRPATEFRGVPGLVVLDQVRTVDKARLLRRLGKVDDKTLAESLAMMRWLFAD
jgi:mRNA interferase MazF